MSINPINLQSLQRVKTLNDFMQRDKMLKQADEEFKLRKQEGAQKSQINNLKIQQAQSELSKPSAFQGKAWDAQVANEVYKFHVQKGLDPVNAKRAAIDELMKSKKSTYTDPITGQQVVREGSPIFNINTSAPQQSQQGVAGFDNPEVYSAMTEDAGADFILPQKQAPQNKDPNTLYNLADKTAGLGSSLKNLYAGIAGQVGLPIDEETVEARQTVKTAKNELIRALSINRRFPVGEIDRIEKEIDIAPSVWESEASQQAKMRSIHDSLDVRLKREVATANDASVPPDQRKSAMQSARDIGAFLKQLGANEQSTGNDLDSENDFDSAIDKELKRRGIN